MLTILCRSSRLIIILHLYYFNFNEMYLLFFEDTASPTFEVPVCCGYEEEIGPDSTNDFYSGRFQVSPLHTTGFINSYNSIKKVIIIVIMLSDLFGISLVICRL